jgi:hypothetical protein
MPFEYFVRPFQSTDSHGRVILPATPSGFERATLTWGAKTTANQVQLKKEGQGAGCCKDTRTQNKAEKQFAGQFMQQIWGPGTAGPPRPHGQWGASVDTKRSVGVLSKVNDTNSCADDWTQMSYVASAVESVLADLKDDIESVGGKTVDHCKARINSVVTEAWEFTGDPAGAFPQKVPAFPPPSLAGTPGLVWEPPAAPA